MAHDHLTLAAIRRARRLSVGHVARELGVHPMSVYRWERRERFPGPAHVLGLARLLSVDTTTVAAFFDAARSPARATGLDGRAMRLLRRERAVSAAELADLLGVPVSTVYNWEAGRARIPRHHLAALAARWGLAVDDLRDRLAALPAPAPVCRRPSALRRLRIHSGLSRVDVASRIGTTRHAVGDWEAGRSAPPLWAVRRLAVVYGVGADHVARAAGLRPPRMLDAQSWTAGSLPEVVRTLRSWSGATQRQLAWRCGCSTDSVRNWELGRTVPSPALRRALEEAFRLPTGALTAAYPAVGTARRPS